MSAFIDFQGFQEDQGIFVLKELVIQPLSPKLKQIVKIFKPPCERSQVTDKFKKIISKCESTYHGMAWEFGTEEYSEIANIINQDIQRFTYLFVKGEDKKKWLAAVIRNNPKTIFNLNDLGCPDIKILEEQHAAVKHWQMHLHCDSYKCSLENAERFKSWYIKTFSLKPNMKKSIIHFCATDTIADLSQAEISELPTMAIIKFASQQIDEVWEKLSDKQKKNPSILGLRKCTQHPLQNDLDSTDDFGLFLHVAKKDCLKCREENSNIEL